METVKLITATAAVALAAALSPTAWAGCPIPPCSNDENRDACEHWHQVVQGFFAEWQSQGWSCETHWLHVTGSEYLSPEEAERRRLNNTRHLSLGSGTGPIIVPNK